MLNAEMLYNCGPTWRALQSDGNPPLFGIECLTMILAGDIGGTKCNLAIFRETSGTSLELVFQRRYATRDFSRFEDLVDHFRQAARSEPLEDEDHKRDPEQHDERLAGPPEDEAAHRMKYHSSGLR